MVLIFSSAKIIFFTSKITKNTKKIDSFYQDVRQIIETARKNAVHSVDFCRVQMYWNLGKRIPESPTEVIKKPVMLEFLGIHPETSYYEKDLEGAIISHLTDFLLEVVSSDIRSVDKGS